MKCKVCEFVYVIAGHDDGPVKIGISIRPSARNGQLRKQTKRDLYVYAKTLSGCSFEAAKVESACHSRLAERHHHGDWFSVSLSEAHTVVQEIMAGGT